MKTVCCTKEQCAVGPLVLVNAAHPLRQAALPPLLEFPERKAATVCAVPQAVLLERKTVRRLTACINATGGAQEIIPVSGWRSRKEQQQIWDETLAAQGERFTRQYVALPGCSEHQTGYAIDLARRAAHVDFIRPSFPNSGACGAFRTLAASYGFVQRYTAPKEAVTGIACEPWHFRYVGAPHAAFMVQNGLCLEEYIALLHAGAIDIACFGGRSIHVFHVVCEETQLVLEVPDGCVQVSGDNTDGLIVTVWGEKP